MENCSTTMSQADIVSLKDALCAQQKLLQQLYNELEAEREASATAASEALSVILRLQGEKAAVKMEAEQYKRLAEEKMGYAEESLTMIEDMITEKEMEVAELDYQVQTYRYQLMSMGFDVPAGDDISFPEHLKGKMAMLERGSSTCTDLESISKHVEEHEINEFASDSAKKADSSSHEVISCFAGQIKELQQRVKDISGANIPDFMSESHSPSMSSRLSAANLGSLPSLQSETKLPSQLSISGSCDPSNLGVANESANSPPPPTVHDVFEVPQADHQLCESSDILKEAVKQIPKDEPKKLLQSNHHEKHICKSSDTLENQDRAHQEEVKPIPKDEPDWLKRLLQSTNHEKHLCKPSDIAAIDRAVGKPTTDVDISESNVNKLDRSLEIIEAQRLAESSNREEELKLLKEIKEKLNALQDEITIQKVKNSLAREEPSLKPLSEVMFSFWL